jgi:integrase
MSASTGARSCAKTAAFADSTARSATSPLSASLAMTIVAPVTMAWCSALASSAVATSALRVRDVFAAGHVKERASMIQSKTGKPVRFEITEITRLSLKRWIRDPEMIGREFLWPSRVHGSPHLSIRQYARIVRGWVMSLGLDPSSCGTHSMRRTKVAQICKRTGNLRAVQLLLGHTKMDSTVRYLGVDIEDALSLSEGIDL